MKVKLNNSKTQQGFTLIEILVVVALIAILAAITVAAINPAKLFRDTRNSTRQSDVSTILNAVSTYLATEGNSIQTLETAVGTIGNCGTADSNIGNGTNNINLAAALVPNFTGSLPKDPQATNAPADTDYDICKGVDSSNVATGRITIKAPRAEGKTIELTR